MYSQAYTHLRIQKQNGLNVYPITDFQKFSQNKLSIKGQIARLKNIRQAYGISYFIKKIKLNPNSIN